ncbi:hypothetical protein H7J07_05240 [Mycobacterium koreense]|uniref:hypothetical protein n=1 Tax=Mycolicibacillus koreensis TaxID=1069220 RepID=UPI001056CABE|nr:hypothetical protein [Mycolicibacillus koreensis]MCV7247629.1 hypothetical protein [Mycolicibacillus koreensis]BBY54009.1 hypothetical protein MKOR_12600 [Mycolicibacillus koreensis]
MRSWGIRDAEGLWRKINLALKGTRGEVALRRWLSGETQLVLPPRSADGGVYPLRDPLTVAADGVVRWRDEPLVLGRDTDGQPVTWSPKDDGHLWMVSGDGDDGADPRSAMPSAMARQAHAQGWAVLYAKYSGSAGDPLENAHLVAANAEASGPVREGQMGAVIDIARSIFGHRYAQVWAAGDVEERCEMVSRTVPILVVLDGPDGAGGNVYGELVSKASDHADHFELSGHRVAIHMVIVAPEPPRSSRYGHRAGKWVCDITRGDGSASLRPSGIGAKGSSESTAAESVFTPDLSALDSEPGPRLHPRLWMDGDDIVTLDRRVDGTWVPDPAHLDDDPWIAHRGLR